MRKLEAVKAKDLNTGDVVQLGNYHSGFSTARIELVQKSKMNSRFVDVTMTTLDGKYASDTPSISYYGAETRFSKVVA